MNTGIHARRSSRRLASFPAFGRTEFYSALALAKLRCGVLLNFSRCRFRKFLPGFDGGGVSGDVSDEPVFLRFANKRLVGKLHQFHLSELGKGPRESRFMRQSFPALPAADQPELFIAPQ